MIKHSGQNRDSGGCNTSSITTLNVMMMAKTITAAFDRITVVMTTWNGSCLHGIAALPGAPHDILELLVHGNKGLGFMRQLALDVRSREDGLQIHPVLLASQPLI